ncbi:MAG TPA: MFS transporter [Candidatus Dormibacteraeota bacterium]|nr:MFS transporter [Candidatus Dormibacteraeota bacterium]
MSQIAVAEQESGYRWVMAAVCGLIMSTSFISLTAFGIAAPDIAKTMNVPLQTLTTYGVDSFAIGLFVAFFLGHGGIFDSRIKTGVLVAQIFLIVPQLLIPTVSSLWLLTVLRFSQGLMIMMLALFSVQLSGWFKPSQRGISLAATAGSIPLGGALGGILSGRLASLGWQEMYYITAGIMILGALVYFVFAKDSETLKKQIEETKGQPHESAWKYKITWLMGIVQIPLTWSLFSIGGFLPAYAYHLGYSQNQVGNVMFAWGIAGFFAAFLGSWIGDLWSRNKTTNQGILRARLNVMNLADLIMGIGAIMILYLAPISYAWLMIAAIFGVFMQMIAPNYWATPGNVFPVATMGAGAFAMGVISNSTSAIGPVVSSAMVPTLGWTGVFWVMAILAFLGIGINYWAAHTELPIDTVH